jgi:O-antigen/teichoic acid export membrane protein
LKIFTKNIKRVLSSKIISVVAALLTSVLIARVLGPETNGEIAAILVYPSVFMSLGTLGIRQSTTFYIGKNIFPLEDIKSSIAKIWVSSSLISILLSSLLILFFSNVTDDYLIITLAVLPIPFYLFNSYISGIYLGKNEIKSFNRVNWIPPTIIFFTTLILIYHFRFGIEGYLLAIVLGNLGIFLLLFTKNEFGKHLFSNARRKVSKKLIGLGLMYAVSLFIITLNYKFDIILLDQLSTSKDTGIYSKGAGVAQYLWQIPMLFSTLIFAGSANSKNDTTYSSKVFSLLRVTLFFSILVATALFLLSDDIIVLLFGKEFAASANSFNILLPGVILLIFFKVLNMDLAGKGKPLVSLKAMLPALIINIILNYQFIPKYGSDGAALASSISYGLGGILFLYFYSKTIKVPIRVIISPRKADYNMVKKYLFNK